MLEVQLPIFLNSEIGRAHLQLWAAANPEVVQLHLTQTEDPTRPLSPQERSLLEFFKTHPQLEGKTPAEQKALLERYVLTQEDEHNVTQLNEYLIKNPAVLKDILSKLNKVQKELRAQAKLDNTQEKQETIHLDIVENSMELVTQGLNPIAVIDANLHDVHKYRPPHVGGPDAKAVMNLFLHEENSQLAAEHLLEAVLTQVLPDDQKQLAGVSKEAIIASAVKVTSVAIAHHGHGEFPRNVSGANNEFVPEPYRGLLGVPQMQFGENLYPNTPSIESSIPLEFTTIRETTELLNGLDAATGCLPESFGKNNNSYGSIELAQTPLIQYLTEKLTSSFEGNLMVPGAQALATQNSETAERFRAFQADLRMNKELYTQFVTRDFAQLEQSGEFDDRARKFNVLNTLHLALQRYVSKAEQNTTEEEFQYSKLKIESTRQSFNETLSEYITMLSADITQAKAQAQSESR